MAVYFIYFSLLGIACGFAKNGNRKVGLFIIAFLTWLLIGLRDVSVGADTMSYVNDFNYFRELSFGSLWELITDNSKELLYILITWILGQISDSYTVFLLGWALFPAISLYIISKENLNSKIQYFEVVLIMCLLGLYAFFIAGIRQTAAISIVLISYKYLKDGKLIKFLFCIAVAYLIHNSSILFIIAYPLRYIRVRWWFPVVLVGLYIASSTIQIDGIVQLAELLFKDRFAAYGTSYESTQNASAFLIQLVLYMIVFYKIQPLAKKDPTNNILFVLATIGLFFQSLAGMLAEMSRISLYFCVFDVILVPRALAEYNANIRPIINTAFIVTCLILLLFISKSNLPLYEFA